MASSAASSSDLLLRVARDLIPPLTSRLHKGVCGRVLVAGGSEEYTGAPFLAACASLRTGADLAHVVCARAAAVPIKSYSCELIVQPVLDSAGGERDLLVERLAPRLTAVVVGPGLGRSEELQEAAARLVQQLMVDEYRVPILLDADGLQLLINQQIHLSGWWQAQLVTITPNVAELRRLCGVLQVEEDREDVGEQVSRRLGGVLVVQKAACDVITLTDRSVVCDVTGSGRRCGGQGDVLAGVMAAMLGWSSQASDSGLRVEAAYAACAVTRRAACLAFERFGRGMLASHLLDCINPAFQQLFHIQ